MKTLLKWIAVIAIVLVIAALAASWYFANKYETMRKVTFDVADSGIIIPKDSVSVERGRYLVNATCIGCHGNDLSGTEFFNEPDMGHIHALNLTKGNGSAVNNYTDEDWIRAIRHGVRKNKKGIMIMPSESFTHLSDEDLACMVAYIKTIPPVDKKWPEPEFTYMTRVIAGAGGFGVLYPAEIIDHKILKGKTAPASAATSEYGEYLVTFTGCRSCHGQELNGKQPPDPVSPFAPNISPGGNLGKWTVQDFIKTMRNGVTPEGKALNKKFMPWIEIGHLNDEDLTAIYLYLQSQPELKTAQPE